VKNIFKNNRYYSFKQLQELLIWLNIFFLFKRRRMPIPLILNQETSPLDFRRMVTRTRRPGRHWLHVQKLAEVDISCASFTRNSNAILTWKTCGFCLLEHVMKLGIKIPFFSSLCFNMSHGINWAGMLIFHVQKPRFLNRLIIGHN